MAASNDWMLAKVNARNEKHLEEIKRLKGDIESERNNIREINVVHKAELMAVQQQEHDRAHVMMCDLRTQLNQEKNFELSKQKEMLKKRHEAEFQALMQEHQEGIQKMEDEFVKQKGNLERSFLESRHEEAQKTHGMQTEINRLIQELREVKTENQHIGTQIELISHSDKQKNDNLRRVVEAHEVQLSKSLDESRKEAKRLLEELKIKNRIISRMQKDLGVQMGETLKASLDKENAQRLLEISIDGESWGRRSEDTTPRRSTSPVQASPDLSISRYYSIDHSATLTSEPSNNFLTSALPSYSHNIPKPSTSTPNFSQSLRSRIPRKVPSTKPNVTPLKAPASPVLGARNQSRSSWPRASKNPVLKGQSKMTTRESSFNSEISAPRSTVRSTSTPRSNPRPKTSERKSQSPLSSSLRSGSLPASRNPSPRPMASERESQSPSSSSQRSGSLPASPNSSFGSTNGEKNENANRRAAAKKPEEKAKSPVKKPPFNSNSRLTTKDNSKVEAKAKPKSATNKTTSLVKEDKSESEVTKEKETDILKLMQVNFSESKDIGTETGEQLPVEESIEPSVEVKKSNDALDQEPGETIMNHLIQTESHTMKLQLQREKEIEQQFMTESFKIEREYMRQKIESLEKVLFENDTEKIALQETVSELLEKEYKPVHPADSSKKRAIVTTEFDLSNLKPVSFEMSSQTDQQQKSESAIQTLIPEKIHVSVETENEMTTKMTQTKMHHVKDVILQTDINSEAESTLSKGPSTSDPGKSTNWSLSKIDEVLNDSSESIFAAEDKRENEVESSQNNSDLKAASEDIADSLPSFDFEKRRNSEQMRRLGVTYQQTIFRLKESETKIRELEKTLEMMKRKEKRCKQREDLHHATDEMKKRKMESLFKKLEDAVCGRDYETFFLREGLLKDLNEKEKLIEDLETALDQSKLSSLQMDESTETESSGLLQMDDSTETEYSGLKVALQDVAEEKMAFIEQQKKMEIEKLEAKIHNLQVNDKKLKEKVSKLGVQRSNIKIQLAKVSESETKAREKVIQLEWEMTMKTKQACRVCGSSSEQTNEISDSKEAYLKRETKDLQREIQVYGEKLRELRDENIELKTENDILVDKISEHKEIFNEQRDHLSNEVEHLKKKVEQKNVEMKELKEKVKRKESQVCEAIEAKRKKSAQTNSLVMNQNHDGDEESEEINLIF